MQRPGLCQHCLVLSGTAVTGRSTLCCDSCGVHTQQDRLSSTAHCQFSLVCIQAGLLGPAFTGFYCRFCDTDHVGCLLSPALCQLVVVFFWTFGNAPATSACYFGCCTCTAYSVWHAGACQPGVGYSRPAVLGFATASCDRGVVSTKHICGRALEHCKLSLVYGAFPVCSRTAFGCASIAFASYPHIIWHPGKCHPFLVCRSSRVFRLASF